jgi:hypothetical protein
MKKSYFNKSVWLASLGCLLAVAVACGDDDDSSSPEPGGGTKNTAGTDSTGGKNTTGGKTGTGGTNNTTAGKSGTAGTTSENMGGGGAGNDMPPEMGGAGGEASCTDDADKGCFLIAKCKPTKREDFLNACPTTGCQGFDNKKLTSIKAVVPQSL